MRALAAFRIKPVTELQDLLGNGYDVYLDWERRIGDERLTSSYRGSFDRWMTSVFARPYGMILGAYSGDRLVAFMTSYAAGGFANCSKIFGHSEFNPQTPSSALLYSFVKIASNNPEIRRVWHGLHHTNPSLQRYKSVMGFDLVSYPAYIKLRAGIRPLAQWCFPTQYRRLMGQYDADEAA